MTLSLSSSVFPCFRSSLFFLLVSFESIGHLECHKVSKCVKGPQWQSRGVSRVFLGWFNVVSKEFKIVYFGCKYSNYNYQDFLAAMSSSRSDVVTQFVCVCFRVCFRPSPFFFF